MKEALDNDSHIVSPELSTDFQKLFSQTLLMNLLKKTASFFEIERYVTILFDEMKIQENLLLDKHSGELLGFADLGDINVNVPTLKNTQTLATHVLVFCVKGVVNPVI